MLQGTITALITPMDENGAIDFIALENLVNAQINAGIKGLVVAGTTGEAALLTNDEKIALINRVIAINRGRALIIVGVSQAATKFSCDFIDKYLNKITGIDYILALTPYYIKPTQEGLYQYFRAIASVSKYPIILYNVPSRTGCDLQDATVIRLAEDCKNIIGLKDATGDMPRVLNLVATKSSGFSLYSGDDKTALQFMLNGGNGVISVISNIIPDKISQMSCWALSATDDLIDQAIQLNNDIAELNELLFVESNPIPVKWAAFRLDLIRSPTLRSPLTELTPDNQKKMAIVLDQSLGY